jgi:hypothetical protein
MPSEALIVHGVAAGDANRAHHGQEYFCHRFSILFRFLPLLVGGVHQNRIEFSDALDGNSISLFYGQWVVRGLKLDRDECRYLFRLTI